LRSGEDHCDLALAVEVQPGTNLILGLLFGSGGDHCDHELAVEVRKRRRGMRRRTRPADLKSNNPNLTGGESGCSHQPRTYVIIIWVCAIKNIFIYIYMYIVYVNK
jgi:hypothetical protein